MACIGGKEKADFLGTEWRGRWEALGFFLGNIPSPSSTWDQMSKTLADLCGNMGRETMWVERCEFWCLGILRFPKVDVDSEATYYTTPGGHCYKNPIWLCSQELCHMMACGWGQESLFGWNPKYEEFSLSHALLTIRRRWRKPLAEGNHRGERMWKCMEQSFALSTPWWVTPWPSSSGSSATFSVYPHGLCRVHGFLWEETTGEFCWF